MGNLSSGSGGALSALRGVQVKTCLADQQVNNSTTLVNSTYLLFPVFANEVWNLYSHLLHNTSAIANIKFRFTAPVGAVMNDYERSYGTGTPNYALVNRLTGDFVPSGLGADNSAYMRLILINGANAGVITLQFAQNTQEATNTKLLANSHIFAYRIRG